MVMNSEYRFPNAEEIVIPKKLTMRYGREYVYLKTKNSSGPWVEVLLDWAEENLIPVN